MKTIIALLLVLILTSGCATSPPQKEDTPARQGTCINNMRIIDSAILQNAFARNLTEGDNVAREDISTYIRNGIDSLVCPTGGKYELGTVGTDPKCSIHGTLSDATLERIRNQ